jgi:long-subunit acyl-CoA synthetase (AMP-forming)
MCVLVQEVSYIINHSESTIIFVEDRYTHDTHGTTTRTTHDRTHGAHDRTRLIWDDRAQFDKVEAEKEHLPLLKHVIIFNGETAGTRSCHVSCVVRVVCRVWAMWARSS